ncbi:uncharacterized protein LOC143891991 [Tasmannia lanceolata]|uniref:uncharacterized protein LOC143891991 n=1 Tax=Tasmannia lanceolata TaxID=3420 RepID=UPI004062A594
MESKGEYSFLPQDIIDVNILPRLPAKSLLRFTFVCQTWKTRISCMLPTPPNLVCYDHKNPSLSFLSFKGCPTGEPDYSIEFVRRRYNKMIASCNGLLVFGEWDTPNVKFYIYNPVTRDDDFPDLEELRYIFFGFPGLDFDPLKANPCYKLVIPFEFLKFCNYELHFQVFSLKTNKWELSKTNIICSDRFYIDSQSFYIGGFLYWKVKLEYSLKILEFNPDGNEASLISLPSGTQLHEYAADVIEKWKPYGDVMIGEWDGRHACTRTI